MKNYIHIILSAIILTSCSVDEFLDVKPTGVVIPQTLRDYELLLNNPNNNSNYWSNLDYKDPDVYLNNALYNRLVSSVNIVEMKEYKWQDDLYTAVDNDPDWNSGYANIYTYNTIIEGVNKAPLEGMTENDRALIKGEAFAQRAMEYYLLANEYGPAYSNSNRELPSIPMPLVPNINEQPAKQNVGFVFDQILSDLKIANQLLGNTSPVRENANFRPGSASVKALLAMVSLQRGDFADAKTYATQALSAYSFLYDYTTLENNTLGDGWSGVNNPDLEFAIKDKSILWNRASKQEFSYPYNGHLYSPELLELFDQVNDQRFALFNSRQILDFANQPVAGVNVSPNFVYASINKTAQAGLTVGNLLLVLAEASIRTNDKATAIEALNSLLIKRIKSYTLLTDSNFVNNEAVLQRIKDERRKELIGTGYYVVDLKRYHTLGEAIPTFTRIVDTQTYTLEPGSSKYIVTVPPKVRALNPNLN